MSKAKKVIIVVKGKVTGAVVSPKTAEKSAGESERRIRAQFRKNGKGS
jgi:hypothetical protein